MKLDKVALKITADVHTAKQAAAVIEKKLAALGVGVCDCAKTTITLALGDAPAQVQFAEQGYRIAVTADGVELTGFGAQGVYYAAVSFVQLLGKEIPCCDILDWPDMAFRGHVLESRLGSDLMEKEDWFAMIDDLAGQKINHLQVNVYGCWLVQYDGGGSEYLYVPIDGYPELKTPFHVKYYSPTKGEWVEGDKLPPMFEKNFFGELVAYGYERGVKVFPGFNSYGHNTLIPHTYPELSAKDEEGNPSYSGFCTSNPDVYKLLFTAYDQLIDKYMKPYGSDCIALQLDEVWAKVGQYAGDIFSKRSPWCKCPKCKDLNEGLLFVEHTVRLVKHLKEKGMKRVFICCDMLIDHGPNGVGVLTEPLLAALKREDVFDTVTITWWTYADLWEKLMFHTTQPEGNSSCLANYFMLRDRLSYSFYSYVEEGKPYPRNFPGEAMEKVCARKEDHLRAMYAISGMAKEAKGIWETIAADPACNQEQARRYAYEADNYMVLVDDYLAMLRMMELTEEGEYDEVKAMAEARRDTRIALMARLEQVKDGYQQPWNLHNHSIFMQFFEDLRVYIENTPADKLDLNFFDMRHFASERFMWLR